MDAAINMVNEFMPEGRLIVYTEGKAFPRNDVYTNGTGTCQDAPIVVLTDEFSASASEIFSGAIQDNDRGLIIGRRTFGKGLVQSPIQLSDGSEIRLTIARYYTPSGRCIQKKYELGKDSEYEQDIYQRFMHGEFDSADSIKLNNSEKYETVMGRPVYGGGGIMLPENEIDLIIVPGVAFDRQRNRLGRGKGFYDRLLSTLNVPKIGISYDFQLKDQIPVEPFDRKMDLIITEKEII